MHKFNVVARIVVTCIWVLIYVLNDIQMSGAKKSVIAGIIFADIITWVVYQVYLLPRKIMHFSIGTLINLIAIIVLLKFVKISAPDSMEWWAISVMVFLVTGAIKTTYYYFLEMYLKDSET